MPPLCACCGQLPSETRLERGPASVIIPYCARCLRHASARTTRNLAAAVGSCVLAFTLALAAPLALPHTSIFTNFLLVTVLVCLPIAVRFFVPRKPRAGHTAMERAVWWVSSTELVCTNSKFASELARGNDLKSRAIDPREPRLVPWLAAGPVLAVVLAPSGWLLHHPLVRVVNLSDTRAVLRVDGREMGSVEATSSESPAAGVELRLPAGVHEVSATTPDGRVVSQARVELRSGARHLYAPGSAGTCFWLEETRYGRARTEPQEVVALGGTARFWVLDRHVDSWFSPNPPAAQADQRSSGGVLWALRQAPCVQAPKAAREP